MGSEVVQMLKKLIVLSVLAVTLTGCVVAPYDDHYSRDGRNYSGQYDHDHRWNREQGKNTRPDWRNQNRYDRHDDH